MYYVWESRRSSEGQALVSKFVATGQLYGVSFLRGRRFSVELPELTLELDADSQGDLTDDLVIFKRRCLVHSWRLRDVLREVGVDNIDYYPCVIANEVSGRKMGRFLDESSMRERYFYKAANILDLIYCLDREASAVENDDEEPSEIWYINDLRLLEDRIGDVRMFRLGEDPSIVIVHEEVKTAVERAGLTGVMFLPATGYRDYQGYAFDNPRNVIGTHDLDPFGPADEIQEA